MHKSLMPNIVSTIFMRSMCNTSIFIWNGSEQRVHWMRKLRWSVCFVSNSTMLDQFDLHQHLQVGFSWLVGPWHNKSSNEIQRRHYYPHKREKYREGSWLLKEHEGFIRCNNTRLGIKRIVANVRDGKTNTISQVYTKLMERFPRWLVTWFVAPELGNQQLSSINSGWVGTIAFIPPKGALLENGAAWRIFWNHFEELVPIKDISNLWYHFWITYPFFPQSWHIGLFWDVLPLPLPRPPWFVWP